MLFLFCALSQVPESFKVPYPMYAHDERALRDRIGGTVWQPGVTESFPGILSEDDLVITCNNSYLNSQYPAVYGTELA